MVERGRESRSDAAWLWSVQAIDFHVSPIELETDVRRLWADTAENNVYINALLHGREDVRVRRLWTLRLLGETLRDAGRDPRYESLSRQSGGKPFLIGREGEIDVSLAHSERYAACAVLIGRGRVGVDVEEYGAWTDRRADRVAERFFSDGEREIARTATDFIKLWTLREAVCKLDGGGNPLRVDAAHLPQGVWQYGNEIPGGWLTVVVEPETITPIA